MIKKFDYCIKVLENYIWDRIKNKENVQQSVWRCDSVLLKYLFFDIIDNDDCFITNTSNLFTKNKLTQNFITSPPNPSPKATPTPKNTSR
jgi:hypothetical protein